MDDNHVPELLIGIICFFCSAVMELFIQIPFSKSSSSDNIFKIGYNDLKSSLHFMTKEVPQILGVTLIVCAINLFMSSLIIIGLPVLVTTTLDFLKHTGNNLYGYEQGALALGSLLGGLFAGILSKKLNTKNTYFILILCSLTLIPIAFALLLPISSMTAYIIILVSCFFMMIFAALFSILMMAYLQMITPPSMIGKIISCAMCIGMCSQPLGQAIYGFLFDLLKSNLYLIFFGCFIITFLLSIFTKGIFKSLDSLISKEK